MRKTYAQGRYWLLTIPQQHFTPWLPPRVSYIQGQLECGTNTGYLHWQLLVYFEDRIRLSGVTDVFGDSIHAELSRSSAATSYTWKDESAVQGTRFSLGRRPIQRNNKADWDAVKEAACRGDFDSIPSDILLRHYGNIRRLAADHLRPLGEEREVSRVTMTSSLTSGLLLLGQDRYGKESQGVAGGQPRRLS